MGRRTLGRAGAAYEGSTHGLAHRPERDARPLHTDAFSPQLPQLFAALPALTSRPL